MNKGYYCQSEPQLEEGLKRFLLRSVPRILTQLDRDPDSPTFGCFDRDFWHYRIRDFSSIVLQQGALVLQTLHNYPDSDNPLYKNPQTLSWIDACLSFWATQQLPSGAFNEYYPNEEGFPPTAFSLYAVALIFKERGFPEAMPAVLHTVRKAADWLLSIQESQALNQEAVALAALVLSSRIPSVNIDMVKLEKRLEVLFAAQSAEGWFPEYGGADSGYLSVTLDALAVYFDLTGDPRAEIAMNRALEFISQLISVSGTTPVMINSRNTDYIAPYGLIRMAASSPLARSVVEALFSTTENPAHFLNATDDRYLCHYIYHSCFRGLEQLSRMTVQKAALPCEEGSDRYYPDAGIHTLHIPECRSIYIAARKGGVYYLYNTEGIVSADYGWRYKDGKGRVALTHWQHPENLAVCSQKAASIDIEASGVVSIHGWPDSTPLRHGALRVLSYFLGKGIIVWLKKVMIFKAESYGLNYSRKIRVTESGIYCSDRFSGAGIRNFNPVPAPAYSLRHVASAANFNREELAGSAGVKRTFAHTAESLTITSTIDFTEMLG